VVVRENSQNQGLTADWAALRADYPSLAGKAFLNTATFGQLSLRSEAAIASHLAQRRENACMDYMSWYDDHDRLRGKLARLINASASEIAFVQNASWALAHVLNGLDWHAGDEVLTAEREFPNNLYFTEHLAGRGVVPVRCPYDRILDALTPRSRLVVLSTVNWATGYRSPIDECAAEFRRRGVLLALDATQSLGALKFDFAAVQPDLLAVDCYKWMLAPNGAAFMAVAPELRKRLAPLAVGWRSHKDWRRTERLHEGVPEFMEQAERYEAGMLSSLPLYALEASVDRMLEIGPENIERRVLALASEARSRIRAIGGEPLPYEDSAITASGFPGHDVDALARELQQRRVLVSARYGMLRVSTHFYNDESDLDRLIESLRELL
jgi:selenocysteine lyase/cysteine desulfurase